MNSFPFHRRLPTQSFPFLFHVSPILPSSRRVAAVILVSSGSPSEMAGDGARLPVDRPLLQVEVGSLGPPLLLLLQPTMPQVRGRKLVIGDQVVSRVPAMV